ncbi:MAG: hypothetical protein ACLP9L_19515 [Thermoguttaceae bacterium]
MTKRYSHGLYLLAGYTYAHAIDTATSNLAGVPPDSNNYSEERGNGDFDIRHRFTLSITYDLPSMKTRSQLLEGWQVTSIVNLQAGEPYTLGDFNDDLSLTGEYNDRWNMTGPASNIHWSQIAPLPYVNPDATVSPFNLNSNGDVISGNTTAAQACVTQAYATGGVGAADNLGGPNGYDLGCYVSGSTVITPPAFGSQGNMGRNIFRGPSFANWDMGVSKVFKLGERFKLQLRGEMFNILNHANFDVFTMNTDLSAPSTVGTVVYTPDVAAANPVIGSGGSRHIQIAAKVIW